MHALGLPELSQSLVIPPAAPQWKVDVAHCVLPAYDGSSTHSDMSIEIRASSNIILFKYFPIVLDPTLTCCLSIDTDSL